MRTEDIPQCISVQKLKRTEILKEVKDQIKSIKGVNRPFPTAILVSMHLHFYEASSPCCVSF